MIATIFNLIVTAIEIASPFIIKRTIEFIQDPEEEVWIGITLITTLVISQSILYIIVDHIDYYQRIIGVKSTNALISLIYKKSLKVSNATNKRFQAGEVVNFV